MMHVCENHIQYAYIQSLTSEKISMIKHLSFDENPPSMSKTAKRFTNMTPKIAVCNSRRPNVSYD